MATDAPPAPRLTDRTATRVPGDAEQRIVRQFAIFTSAGYIAYGLLCAGNIVKSFSYMSSWWALGGPIAVFGSGMAIGVVAALGKQDLIKPAIVVAVAAYVIVALLVPIAWKNGALSDERGLWFSQFPGVVGVAIGGAWPRARALVYLAVLTTIATLMSRVVRPAELIVPLGPDLAFAFAYCLPFTAAVIIGVRTARLLDETRMEAFHLAARAAAARARDSERRRFDALTHDGVMTVLLGAARQGPTKSLRALASDTIAELGSEQIGSDSVPATAAIALLQSAVTDIDDAIAFTDTRHPPVGLTTYPQEVLRTMSAAMAEALRNSLRHAGPTAGISVRVTVSADRLAIEITDDGVGFDLARIPPHRLGIAVSVRGRMEQLPGGVATIRSVPGQGTQVTLEWVKPI
ncbi:sensor histidine kinase [Williamsia sp. M5A3_1d]